MTQPSHPILRFAPSPNGRLHLGHAYSALFTAYWAEALGGRMLVRIEDIDTARCRPEYSAAVFADLDWLGISFPQPVRRQSEHFSAYHGAAARLEAMGLLYPCFCSRSAIRAAGSDRSDPDGAPFYPGTCRGLDSKARAHKLGTGMPVQYRLDMERALALVGLPTIREILPTPADAPSVRTADPARWGDVVLVRKDTPTSYHLAVVVDDALQGITHVTRGMDLYAATDIHVLLQVLLDLPAPLYCHHQLIRDGDARKLSKSLGSESLADLRSQGWTAADVRSFLGF